MASPVEQQIDSHLQAVSALKASAGLIEAAATMLIEAFKAGHRAYVFGNGGSAADAQHIAAELVGRFKRGNKPPLPAMALTTDTSILTAVSNDFGFEQVFKRQLEALIQQGDVVWALSVSGSSPNILEALKAAQHKGAKIIGFTGQNGKPMGEISDICLLAPHVDSDRVQEIHEVAYHIICGLVEDAFV